MRENGICRVCRKRRPLSFSAHVLPASAFDCDSVPRISGADYEAYLEGLFAPQSYEEGIGHYSLCEKCETS